MIIQDRIMLVGTQICPNKLIYAKISNLRTYGRIWIRGVIVCPGYEAVFRALNCITIDVEWVLGVKKLMDPDFQ